MKTDKIETFEETPCEWMLMNEDDKAVSIHDSFRAAKLRQIMEFAKGNSCSIEYVPIMTMGPGIEEQLTAARRESCAS